MPGSWWSGFKDWAMAFVPDSTDPRVEGGGRADSSYADAAKRAVPRQQGRNLLDSQTDADVVLLGACAARSGGKARPSETRGVAFQRAHRLRANVRELEAPMAQEEMHNERTQAKLKKSEFDGRLREARSQVVNMQKKVEGLQMGLANEQRLRADEGAKLRKANVLLNGKQQEIKGLQAKHDRLQAIVEERNAARLLAGGINIQAAYPTLPEIEEHIRRALTVTVSEWIEGAPKALSSADLIPWVLSRVFLECSKLVDGIVRRHTEFMKGGIGQEGGASTMDEATVAIFHQHVRRHHRTLFPLTGEHLQRACTEVISELGYWLQPAFPGISYGVLTQNLIDTKLGRVVTEYLPILVGATLQHPAVVFSNDCGKVQHFDATIHAESLDGDALSINQPCLVVLPALLVERERGQGFQPLSMRYILPVQ